MANNLIAMLRWYTIALLAILQLLGEVEQEGRLRKHAAEQPGVL